MILNMQYMAERNGILIVYKTILFRLDTGIVRLNETFKYPLDYAYLPSIPKIKTLGQLVFSEF